MISRAYRNKTPTALSCLTASNALGSFSVVPLAMYLRIAKVNTCQRKRKDDKKKKRRIQRISMVKLLGHNDPGGGRNIKEREQERLVGKPRHGLDVQHQYSHQ